RGLGGFRHGARRHARAFGRYKPAIGWPLECHRRQPIETAHQETDTLSASDACGLLVFIVLPARRKERATHGIGALASDRGHTYGAEGHRLKAGSPQLSRDSRSVEPVLRESLQAARNQF